MTRLMSLALLVLLLAVPVQAEMDPSDYAVPPADLTPEEAEALRARIAAEIAADRGRADAEAEVRRKAEAEEAARLAARPLGEQLVDLRCASCHSADSYQQADLGWLGWHATVWRMDLLNGAGLGAGEHGLIADWLYAQHPPTGARAALEWLALLLVAVALPLPWALWRRHKRRTLKR
ncbi:MAG: hypothetical protein JJT99_08155 [Rhodobacteraceae bacterium]|nr:hypothetical protein [Paracoccaceae bacterium]